MRTVRIGAGQGFWGDSPYPALDVVQWGDVQYLVCDALAELTLAILQKARQRDPSKGYVEDMFFPLLLKPCWERGIKILTNAGGLNPAGLAKQVIHQASKQGIHGLKVAVVTGDDLAGRLEELLEMGIDLPDMEKGGDIRSVLERVLFANAYLGAAPAVRALEMGAHVVITGRTADASLFLAPMVHEFGWSWDDWDRLAAGTLLGHLMECSGQCTGGNFGGAWWDVPDMERIGYPVTEVWETGEAVITKPKGTGGSVTVQTVKEQMLYEVHDPSAYISPDVVVDFTSPSLQQVGQDMVRIFGTRGRPRPPKLKVCVGYSDGWMGEATLLYCWPQALQKAMKAEHIVRKQIERFGIHYRQIHVEYIGYNALLGPLAPGDGSDLNEVGLRIAVRAATRREAEILPHLIPPLVVNGPPYATGSGGLPRARELIGLWSTLVPRELVERQVDVEILEG